VEDLGGKKEEGGKGVGPMLRKSRHRRPWRKGPEGVENGDAYAFLVLLDPDRKKACEVGKGGGGWQRVVKIASDGVAR